MTIAPANAERTVQLALPGWALRALGALLLTGVLLNIAGGVLYGKLLRDSLVLRGTREENVLLHERLAALQGIESDLHEIEETRRRLFSIAGVPSTMADPVVVADSVKTRRDAGASSPERAPFDRAPFKGPISRGFSRSAAGSEGHTGCDIAGREGSPIEAPASGIVRFAGWDSILGNLLVLEHEGGWSTRYGHNKEILVSAGEQVVAGQRVSLLGSTGRSSAPHLHLEIEYSGELRDPVTFFPEYR